jgi:hypothetical protein
VVKLWLPSRHLSTQADTTGLVAAPAPA